MVATKSRPRNPPADWKAKTSVAGVCGEAMHLEDHAKHVEKPTDVDIVYGMNPMDLLGDIQHRIKEIKEEGKWFKADQMVMCSGVFSYPKKECDEDYFQWLDDSVAYLKEKYGDKLKSVVAHYDEGFPHCHFFLADMKTLSVNEIDPFRIARRREEDKKKEAAAIGEVYKPKLSEQKKEMAQWLDDYYENVSSKYGQAREIGARKARKYGTTRQVKMELGFEKKAKELADKEADLIKVNRRMAELAQKLAEQQAITKNKNALLDKLLDQLTQEAEKLKQNKNLGASAALSSRIADIRKTALGGGAGSPNPMKLN
jgi:cob(I)alamin adenosyltransferase